MLEQIKRPIEREFRKFEPFFRDQLRTDVKLLDTINNHVVTTQGKQLRPILVFLTAALNGGITQASYIGAGMIELLHSASLIHDDVVDQADERRGVLSVNAIWKSKAAVLAGDFWLAQGLDVAVRHNRLDLLKVMSEAVKSMSEGELLQLAHARKLDVDEATYFNIITHKTAVLIAACCTNGAISANAPDDKVLIMNDFGTNLGIAFQMRDDLFDYQPNGFIGKPTGNDLKEKKLTLPLIHALNQASRGERRQVLALIADGRKHRQVVERVALMVKKYGGMEYAEQKMRGYRDRARQLLMQYPESDYRSALLKLCDYVVERKK